MWIVLASVGLFTTSLLVLLFFLNHFTRNLSLPVEDFRNAREVVTSTRATRFDTR